MQGRGRKDMSDGHDKRAGMQAMGMIGYIAELPGEVDLEGFPPVVQPDGGVVIVL